MTMRLDHAQALRREEEKDYARGSAMTRARNPLFPPRTPGWLGDWIRADILTKVQFGCATRHDVDIYIIIGNGGAGLNAYLEIRAAELVADAWVATERKFNAPEREGSASPPDGDADQRPAGP